MPKVIVTCPDRHLEFNGFYSAAGYFGVGDTTVELTDAQLRAMKGEIERKESILSVREPTEAELEAEAAAAAAAAKAEADAKAEAELEAEIRAEVESKKATIKGKK